MDQYWNPGRGYPQHPDKRFSLKPEQFIASVNLPAPDHLIRSTRLLLVPKPDPANKYSPAERIIRTARWFSVLRALVLTPWIT